MIFAVVPCCFGYDCCCQTSPIILRRVGRIRPSRVVRVENERGVFFCRLCNDENAEAVMAQQPKTSATSNCGNTCIAEKKHTEDQHAAVLSQRHIRGRKCLHLTCCPLASRKNQEEIIFRCPGPGSHLLSAGVSSFLCCLLLRATSHSHCSLLVNVNTCFSLSCRQKEADCTGRNRHLHVDSLPPFRSRWVSRWSETTSGREGDQLRAQGTTASSPPLCGYYYI